MNSRLETVVSRVKTWVQNHQQNALDYLRIYLGLGFFLKGIFFLAHPDFVQSYLTASQLGAMPVVLPFLIALLHCIGGLLLCLGLLTRLSAVIQLPVLVGAVYFDQVVSGGQTQEFTTLVLFCLVLFLFYGSGRLSIDEAVFQQRIGLLPLVRRVISRFHWQVVVEVGQFFGRRRFYWYNLLRIYIGIGLLVKGIHFLTHQNLLKSYFNLTQFRDVPILAVYLIIFVHILGGTLLTSGVWVRLAAAVQIPVVAGAVFFVHLQEGLFTRNQMLEFSALVLVILFVFLVFGKGPFREAEL